MGDFWTFYLNEHAHPTNRAMHLAGTSLAAAFLVLAVVLLNPWLLLPALLVGYAFAWIGHFAFEKNRPATFRHPWRSLASDWKMWGLWLTGRLGRHLEAAGVRSNGS